MYKRVENYNFATLHNKSAIPYLTKLLKKLTVTVRCSLFLLRLGSNGPVQKMEPINALQVAVKADNLGRIV